MATEGSRKRDIKVRRTAKIGEGKQKEDEMRMEKKKGGEINLQRKGRKRGGHRIGISKAEKQEL